MCPTGGVILRCALLRATKDGPRHDSILRGSPKRLAPQDDGEITPSPPSSGTPDALRRCSRADATTHHLRAHRPAPAFAHLPFPRAPPADCLAAGAKSTTAP